MIHRLQTRLAAGLVLLLLCVTLVGCTDITIPPRPSPIPPDRTPSPDQKPLAGPGIPGLYRAQGGGKVRMTTVAAPHEGLGVDCYAWSSSPLRRYVDLVNQWQIISVLQGTPPAFAPKSAELMAALRDFELTYAEYAEFQRGMERYWCLRWLRQHGRGEVDATVLRENVVRLNEIPLVFRVPSMPLQLPGSQVRLVVEGTDLLDIEVDARFLRTLAEPEQQDESQTADAFGQL